MSGWARAVCRWGVAFLEIYRSEIYRKERVISPRRRGTVESATAGVRGSTRVYANCGKIRALTDSKNAIDEFLQMARYITNEISQISPTALYDMQKYYPEIWQTFQDFSESQIFDNIKLNLERGIREGIYRPEIDSDIIAKLYVSKTNCVIDEESFPSKKYDKVKLFKQFFTYHVYGIATPKGLKLLEKHFSE